MKNLKPLLVLSILTLFAACKKDTNIVPETVKPDPLELLTDSGSYTLNGKTYTLQSFGIMRILNSDPNLKVDSVVDHVNYVSGNKDSVFFVRSYTLSNRDDGTVMEFAFFKKYSKTEMKKDGFGMYIPNNLLDLIHVGKYDFQVDYTRLNAHDGVAIDLHRDGQTFSNKFISETTQIKQADENGSHFEVTNFKLIKSGGALLEAKFDAVIFDSDEKPQKVTNGYIRVHIP
jgi:hypothetical protein